MILWFPKINFLTTCFEIETHVDNSPLLLKSSENAFQEKLSKIKGKFLFFPEHLEVYARQGSCLEQRPIMKL